MKVDRYTILHRKDERGVIVDSGVFGPDDEIPEGFEAVEYQATVGPRVDEQEPVAESKLTEWASPIGKGTWVENRPEDAEVDQGSPVQVREDDLTDAEKEALEQATRAATDAAISAVEEVDEGTPEQARDELTDAEQEANAQAEAGSDAEADSVDESDGGTPVQANDVDLADGVDRTPPPQGGPGSGKEAWAQYAAAQRVSVAEDASRDEIIAAIEKAGKPV
jgi:hypothetical protein